MTGDDKWLTSLTPDMPIGKAARIALSARLELLKDAMTAATEPSADPEPVHQLRVAARRASAALKVFDDRLPAKTAHRARRALRRLRRAAGAARETDVFLETLHDWAIGRANVEKPGHHFLNGHIFAARRTAQSDLDDAIDACEADWDKRLGRLSAGLRDGKASLAEFAQKTLARLLQQFDSEINQGPRGEPSRLHAVRVAGKHLRYAIELVAEVLDQAVRTTLYPAMERLQDLLGIENDSQQAVNRLDALIADLTALQPSLLPAVRAGINAFRTFHRDRIANQQNVFAAWQVEWEKIKASSPELALEGRELTNP